VVYVVDTGMVKQKEYNPRTGMDSLGVTPISRWGFAGGSVLHGGWMGCRAGWRLLLAACCCRFLVAAPMPLPLAMFL
jgi:hypothetical protein